MQIGQRMRELREERGLSQSEVARRAGFYRNSLYRFEQGLQIPTATTIERVAEAIGVEPAALFEEGPPAGAERAAALPKGEASVEGAEEVVQVQQAVAHGDPDEESVQSVPGEERAPSLQRGLEARLQHDLMADFAAGEKVLVVSKRQLGNMLVAVQRGQLSVEEAVSAIEHAQSMAGN